MADRNNNGGNLVRMDINGKRYEIYVNDELHQQLNSKDVSVRAEAHEILIKIARQSEEESVDENNRKTQTLCEDCGVWFEESHDCPKSKTVEESEGENPGNCRPVSWNKSSTLLLIHEYQKNILKVEKGIIKKKTLWEILSKKLSEKGYCYNWEQVNGRWKTLYRAYKNVKDNNSKSGSGHKTYEYEKELDEIFENDPIVKPVKTLSSTDKRKINVPEEEEEEGEERKEVKESKPKKSKNNDLVNVMKDYIVYQKDQREAALQRQEAMHKERMGAFTALTDVLKSFANKK